MEKASPRYTTGVKSEPVALGDGDERMHRQQAVDWLPAPPRCTLGVGWTLNGVASALGATPGGAALPYCRWCYVSRSMTSILLREKEVTRCGRKGGGVRTYLAYGAWGLSCSPYLRFSFFFCRYIQPVLAATIGRYLYSHLICPSPSLLSELH